MTKFLERHKLSKLKQEIENIHITEISPCFVISPQSKFQSQTASLMNINHLGIRWYQAHIDANQNWKSGLV